MLQCTPVSSVESQKQHVHLCYWLGAVMSADTVVIDFSVHSP